MKKHILAFLQRGLVAFGFGPIILAILYLILHHNGIVQTLSVSEVCIGIFSLSALAFIAGGMNFIYQVERLPLMIAILIHGGILYISYLITYLINGWLDMGTAPILVFTGIFLLGYLLIWIIIYFISRKNTDQVNKVLSEKRQTKSSSSF